MPHPNMPPHSPLSRPIQALHRPHCGAPAPVRTASRAMAWRVATFVPAVLTTAGLIAAFTDWFAVGGLTPFEAVIILLIAFSFFWIALSVSTAFLGLSSLWLRRNPVSAPGPVLPMDVALLVPVYNESPADVFGNAAAMLAALASEPHEHRFSLFILSDTRDDAIALQELRAFYSLRAMVGPDAPVYYRRRTENTDRKVGNLADWVENWGGAYPAMLVLDADSLMSGPAIVALSDALSADPAAGLIQSFPLLFGAHTLFGRVQQFSNRIYGTALAEGLAKWTDREGNYWGHNAIIRSAAFAACAGLPRMRSRNGEGRLILSHDFVEAGLLRRAGWSVRFLPGIGGSYEEVPPTLIDYVLRDRRWCQGNLQHLRLVFSRGFHAVSRFHLISGAMGYLMSPVWLALLVVWFLVGGGAEGDVITYFSGLNPQVSWPEMTRFNGVSILAFMYAMLLAPKLMSVGAIHRVGIRLRDLGGLRQFVLSVLVEITLSIAYAPVLMVQQSVAVARTALGLRETWVPQARRGGRYGWATLAQFHGVETVLGAAMVAGMGVGVVTLWLLPIGLSLLLAIPLSALSGVNLARHRWSARQLGTPETINAPRIIRRAMVERRRFAKLLDAPDQVAAE
ncbi:glucans biosynthesis glucosyltransferase MdoH [Oceaniglobus ichthyenteri]|uniref:glucans biosynthesis glucosyltransferase MdoH n=1 Tax=Oceaniglobus ichthyenteri TaxID=2136177 RepID=UPI001F0C0E94|nr:glucans biosynthesis glucosyltransferase MdoH [Oceaniglobus ichthyenteri]